MSESTATTLYDYISDESGNAQATANAQNKVGDHREFKINASDGEQQLYLTVVDDECGKYNIPLGLASSHEKNDSSDSANILVPIIPAVYTTPDLDPLHAQTPRDGGYIYIYKGDYLWRELEVLKNGKYKDVNLRTYQGKDQRSATVEMDTRIIVPYKIGGDDKTITLCYSEIQWSWARINSMGGMDSQDFRINQLKPPLLAEAYGISKDTAASNRGARMQEVDLSGYHSSFPNSEPDGKKARLENSNSVTAEHYLLQMHNESSIPVVYLHDPMGIAMDNVRDYYDKQSEFMMVVKQCKAQDHFKSAVIAYHTFYNEKLWKNTANIHGRGYSYGDKSDSAKMFRAAAKESDRTLIEEDILDVTNRKQIRNDLRLLKKIHVEFLEGKFNGEDLTVSNADFVSINETLKDYAELEGVNYIILWSAVHALIHFLNYDPSTVDASLDLNVNRDKPKYADDPGTQYLESLLSPSHELHAILFPSNIVVDEYSKDYDVTGKQPEPANGSGVFRPIAFAAIFGFSKVATRESWKAFDEVIKMTDKILADFELAFKTQWQQSTQTTMATNAIVRLTKAANLPEFEGLHILPKGTAIGDNIVIDAKVTAMSSILGNQAKNIVSENKKGFIKIFDPDTKKIIGYLDPHQIPNYKGAPIKFTQNMWDDMFVNNKTGTAVARMELTVVSPKSRYALEWHKPGITGNLEVQRLTNGLKIGGKYLPAIVAVMEVFNLVSVGKKLKKTASVKDINKTTLSFIGLMHATVSASVALTSEEKVAQLFEKGFKQTGKKLGLNVSKQIKMGGMGRHIIAGRTFLGLNVKFMGGAGAVLSGAGAAMSTWDAVDSFNADDDDAGMAYSVQAVALGGMMIAGLIEGGAIFLGLGPVGWALLAVGIIAGILATVFTDTPLEKWAKHGPFSLELGDRMTDDFVTVTQNKAGKEKLTLKSKHDVLESLMHLLMQPSMIIKKDTTTKPNSIVVEMYAPGFMIGSSTLDIHTTMSAAYRYGHNSTGYKNEAVIKPIATTNLLDKESGAVIGVKYFYTIPTDGKYKFETRGRHITVEQIYIPKKAKVEIRESFNGRGRSQNNVPTISKTATQSAATIDQKDANWVYAKMLYASLVD